MIQAVRTIRTNRTDDCGFEISKLSFFRSGKGGSSQEFTELPKGMLRVLLRLSSLEEVERWVLGFGCHATVVQPHVLRDRVVKTAKEIQARYSES